MAERLVEGSHMSVPSTMISPDVGVSSRLMQRIRVDLPVPEGPIMEMTSPSSTVAFTSLSGVMFGYSLRRWRTSMMLISL